MEQFQEGTDEELFQRMAAFRLAAAEPHALQALLPVLYYDDVPGRLPAESCRASGPRVIDLLEGRSDWTPEEIAELVAWLDGNAELQGWLTEEHARIDALIRESVVWERWAESQ